MAYSRKRSKAHRISRARTVKTCGKHMKNECGGRCTWATNIGCRKRTTKRHRSTKRSTKRKRTVSRRRSSARRINRARTTSVCGQYKKDECPSPQCAWARNIGCRRAMMPVPLDGLGTASSFMSSVDADAAAARARAAAAPEALKSDFCHKVPFVNKDTCGNMTAGRCSWEDSVNKCLPNPAAVGFWDGVPKDELTKRRDDLTKYFTEQK